MEPIFTSLERNILKAKGATDADIDALIAAGVKSRADFNTVGDAATLASLAPTLQPDVASGIMHWAVGAPPPASSPVVIESADVVYCAHCRAKQPKDYKSGDLCVSCGRQAEPILTCFWCSSSGPGRFCRACGAEFVPTAEVDLAILMKREGLAKDEIPRRLRSMEAAEKEVLWGRVRRSRG